MISLVVTCFNEADKLQKCLNSTEGFADELIVVDLGSSDSSVKIANKFGAKVFHHKFVSFVELVRDYAISKTNGDWILVLDPDEILSDNLKVRLKRIVSKEEVIAVNIPRKNIFFGKWIAHTNWWPDRHIRFFKKRTVLWSKEIHSYPKIDGEILDLEAREDLSIVHFGYDSINEFLDRQNRYASIEAANLYNKGLRFSWFVFFWKPVREFLVRFIKHAGFLDGFYGFALTYLMMVYQIEVMIELWELENQS